MPTNTLIPSSSAPTFSQTGKQGWHSRLLYSYAWNYYKDTYDITTKTLYEQIPGDNAKGNHIFPENYWKNQPGRHVRLKGNFRYSGMGGLNLRVGITDGTNTAWIRPNGENYHTFAGNGDLKNVPISFEINISYKYQDSTPNDYFNVTGYYQYEYQDYASGGANLRNYCAFVPLYRQYNDLSGIDLTHETAIRFIVYDQPSVSPMWLTIEELG